MSEKQMVYDKDVFILNDDLDGQPLTYLLEVLQDISDQYPNAKVSTTRVDWDEESGGYSTSVLRGYIVTITEDRLETDSEYQRRLEREEEDRRYKEETKRLKEEAERSHYERLKKKYG